MKDDVDDYEVVSRANWSIAPRLVEGRRSLGNRNRKDFIRCSASPPPPLVSYCVSVYNRSILEGSDREYLPSLVKTLVEDSPEHAELVVTDWFSTDLPLRDWLPNVWTKDLQIIDMEGQFALGKGKAVACERANGEYIFVNDADVLIPKGYTQTIISYLDEGWGSAFPLDFYETKEGGITPSPKKLNEFKNKKSHAGRGQGNYAFRQSDWPKMRGGYGKLEEKTTWGGEDHKIYGRAHSLGPVWRHWIPGFIHQWHPKSFYGN